jgi:hypothetical protein
MKQFTGFSIVGFVFVLTSLVSPAQETVAGEALANTAAISGSGTVNYLPVWKSSAILGNSAVYQHGGGASALVGIATTIPLATLDVNGSSRIRGNLTLYGSLNGALRVLGNVTDPCLPLTSANVIGGFGGNGVAAGVTGATISGGGSYGAGNNFVTDDWGTIGGGALNQAGNNDGSTCDAVYPTVSGGYGNTASNFASTVAGGQVNTASGYGSMVAGGLGNTASGKYSMVAGGYANFATGDGSFAAGSLAKAVDPGSFVWCATGSWCTSVGTNSFQVAADGPIYFYDGPGGAGCNLSAGGGSWNCSSDRNLKDEITAIDARSVLQRVANLPITQWKMKGEPAGLKHIGPMAQDFYAAFGLGDNDRYIALGDGQGVALAAIQALYHQVEEEEQEDRKKDQQISQLTALVEQLQIRLTHLEQSGKK